jgi:predicted PurR-regulated permease PerM
MKGQYQPWSPTLRYLVFGIALILLVVGVWFIRSILQPIIIAAFIAYLINPAVNLLTQRTHMSRRLAVGLVYFITLAVLIGTPSTLTPIFFDQIKLEITEVGNITNQIIAWLSNPNLIPGIPINLGGLAAQLTQFRTTFLSTLQGQALQLLGKTSLGALWLLVILAAVYYFLAEWPRLRNGFIGSFPYEYRSELNELYQRLQSIWMAYLRGQLLLSASPVRWSWEW